MEQKNTIIKRFFLKKKIQSLSLFWMPTFFFQKKQKHCKGWQQWKIFNGYSLKEDYINKVSCVGGHETIVFNHLWLVTKTLTTL